MTEGRDAPVQYLLRPARPEDAGAVATLIRALGYDVTNGDVEHRMTRLRRNGQDVLVAELGGDVVAVLTTARMDVLHRPKPVGRISMLVVDERYRCAGIGSALVAEAERRLTGAGCGLIEVTSNQRREPAHRFYERLGFERTSYRFAKRLRD